MTTALKIFIKIFLSVFLFWGISFFVAPKTFAAVEVYATGINSQPLPSPGDTVSVNFEVRNYTASRIWLVGARVDYSPTAYLAPDYKDDAIGRWLDPDQSTTVSGFGTVSIEPGGCTAGSVSIEARVRVVYMIGLLNFNVSASPITRDVNSIGAGLWGYITKNGVGTPGATVTITGSDGTQSYTSSANGYYEFKHLDCRVPHTLTARSTDNWTGAVYNISSSNPSAFICNGDWRQINVPLSPPSTITPTVTNTPTPTNPACPLNCTYSTTDPTCSGTGLTLCAGQKDVNGVCQWVNNCSTCNCITPTPTGVLTPTPTRGSDQPCGSCATGCGGDPFKSDCYANDGSHIGCRAKTECFLDAGGTCRWDPTNCQPPPGNMQCVECKYCSNIWGCSPSTSVETYEPVGVFGCFPNWGDQSYGPRKEEINRHIGNCNYCNEDPNRCGGGCSGGWSGEPNYPQKDLKECICGNETSDAQMSFIPSPPQPGQSFIVEVTSYKAYDQRTGSWTTQAARRVYLSGTDPSGRPLNFGSPTRSFDRPIGGYTQRVWQWDIPIPQLGNYTFRFYVEQMSWECVSRSIAVIFPPATISGSLFEDKNGDYCQQAGENTISFSGNPQVRAVFAGGAGGADTNCTVAADKKSYSCTVNAPIAPQTAVYNLSITNYNPYTNKQCKDNSPGCGGACNSIAVSSGQTVRRNAGFTVGPWFQAQGGNIAAATGDLKNNLPQITPTPRISEDLDGYPGVVSYGAGEDFNKGGGEISSKGWLTEVDWGGTTYGYDYFYNKAGKPTTPVFTGSVPAADGIYYAPSPGVSISNDLNFGSRKVTVFIDGNLVIDKTITVSDQGLVTFIVKGNINIKGTVGAKTDPADRAPELKGVFIASGQINTNYDGDSSGNNLSAEGIFVGWQGITLGRDLKNDNTRWPAEYFRYNPALLMNVPRVLQKRSMSWTEVAP